MKSEAIVFGVAGILFGLIAGWIIGSQGTVRQPALPAQTAAAPAAAASTPPPALDETKVNAFKTIADRDPKNVEARVQLGNLYFDAERYQDAITWYGEALALAPNDPNVSTDLGIGYYYLNQPDKALAQFDNSLKMDPSHRKTLLNVGIVRAFGKQDLNGAIEVWQHLVSIAPDSPEGQMAKQALESMKTAHTGGAVQQPGS
jgi:tetratricopeptide (TPR) repeat protein